jgi:non-homologous end joining protein Ku
LEQKVIVDTKTAAKPWETTGRYAKHLQELIDNKKAAPAK